MILKVERKLGRTVDGVPVVTVQDFKPRVRLFRYNDIEKAEKELMIENFSQCLDAKSILRDLEYRDGSASRHPLFARRIVEAWTLDTRTRREIFVV